MCGICGEIRFDNTRPNLNNLSKMMEAIAPRGPDADGVFAEGAVALGHRRLSIIDLSTQSNQPMVDPFNGLSIVFNGSIYNYPRLREELKDKGHQFFSHGDTEVILKAYVEWGEDCVKRFEGMFAFVIWNQNKQEVFFARDRMGIKPFYYSLDNKRFRFASTLPALLKTDDMSKQLNPNGLHNQFSLHGVVPAPNTIFNSIKKIQPAHCGTLSLNGQLKENRFWSLDSGRQDYQMDSQEWQQAVRDSLMQAVRKRSDVADVPVGVLLSGGLDSSLLVGLLAEAGVKDLKTFTVGFDDQPEEKGSEFEFSDPVAEKFGTDHYKFHVPNDDLIKRLPEAIQAMSEPMFAQDAIAFYLLSEQVAKEVKVIQSGQGADEVFAGYFWYEQMHNAKSETDIDRFANRYFDRDHDELLHMLNKQYHGEDYTRKLISDKFKHIQGDIFLDKVLNLDVTTLIVDDPVKRVDNMTMAWGLEARVPFLDHHLVELVAAMPPELKLMENGKGLLKKIARGLVPDVVIDRKKGYFPVPALKFVRGAFHDKVKDILTSQACRERGLFNPQYIDKLLDAPDEHLTRIKGSKIWHMALLEWWLQIHAD